MTTSVWTSLSGTVTIAQDPHHSSHGSPCRSRALGRDLLSHTEAPASPTPRAGGCGEPSRPSAHWLPSKLCTCKVNTRLRNVAWSSYCPSAAPPDLRQAPFLNSTMDHHLPAWRPGALWLMNHHGHLHQVAYFNPET